MTTRSILPVLLALAAACSGGADSGADSAREEATYEMPVAAPAVAPPANAPASVGSDEHVAARASAPVQFGTADTAGVAPMPVPGEAGVSLNPMLVRTGTANVEVDSLEQGIAQVRAMTRRLGGIVGNTTVTAGSEQSRQASIELRIPSERFDEAVGGLSPIGRVRQVNVTAEDVGEEYTDVSARVANARRLEARLLDLLDRRTGRLEEILNLEREVARVREEIERYEGRLRYLRTRASVSLLTITLHEPGAVLTTPGERPIRDAFAEAWRNFVYLVAGLIASSGVLIPLGLVLYGLWRAWRWKRRRDRDADAAYREALRRERERAAAAAPPDEPAVRG